MRSISLVVACVVSLYGRVLTAGQTAPATAAAPRLASLAAECSLQRKWVGFWPQLDEGMFINCGGGDILVTHPNNLLGHVAIESPSQALEYIRFFTSADTYMLFHLDDMVELLPGDTHARESAFNIVPPKRFDRFFRRARVRLVDQQACKSGVVFACGREFEIRRVVALTDGRVYEVVESVYEKGFYFVVSRHLIMRDARKIGILHFGKL